MDSAERSQLEKQSQTLRGELKKWEKEFSAANEGRKATRDEIKQNPSIAQKYKDYNKIRDTLNGKPPKSSSAAPSSPRAAPKPQKSLKRKATEDFDDKTIQTPSKRHHQTPRKPEPPADFFDTYDSPSIIRNLFTPTKKQWISPTPQKNGVYYGLFDLMDEENTPQKDKDGNATALVHATPSRKTGNNWNELPFAGGSPRKYSQTPSKRNASLTTPMKAKIGTGPDAARTPSSSVSKLHFPTPSFLRRDSRRFSTTGNGSEALSPPMVRGPRKPLVRGLSSILAGLRKMNEEAQDDDLDALREMEANELPTTKPGKASKSKKPEPTEKSGPDSANPPEIQVEDSQVPHLLSGFDDESKFDSEPETTNRDGAEKSRLGKDGKPLKGGYKKKGQKRTTRKVKIRPTRPGKAIPHDVGKAINFESEEEDEEEVPETQKDDYDAEEEIPDIDPNTGIIPFNSENIDEYSSNMPDDEEDDDSGSDYTASSGGTRYRKEDQSEHVARVQAKKLRRAQLTGIPEEQVQEGGKGGVRSHLRKGVRKVTAVAAQNFRRLKLRNKGAKGGGGGGRYGKRR